MRTLGVLIATSVIAIGSSVSADEQLAYGEYLAGECTSCHRSDGGESEIPSIVGWDAEALAAVLKSYKSGDLDNPAMVSVAKSLDDEQIAALAAYFASLKPKE